MDPTKSSVELKLTSTLLCDVQKLHSTVYTQRDLRLDQRKLARRFAREGIGLLTKTLPRLGKAFDKALLGEVSFDSTGWISIPGSQLPRFLGGLFQCIFSHDGWILPTPCVTSISYVREILYKFYKYELPYSSDQEQDVLKSFRETDDELAKHNRVCADRSACAVRSIGCAFSFCHKQAGMEATDFGVVIKRARSLLKEVFRGFDPLDIVPTNGPGSLSTKEKGPRKYVWTNVAKRITDFYPFDAYYCASAGQVCDTFKSWDRIPEAESSAKVVLVPKDSRGPRLISEEPHDFMWVQQGLRRAIYKWVENHPLTRWSVHFTDQVPNQKGALLGSESRVACYRPHSDPLFKWVKLEVGRYATLDLKEASDRVSLGLVRLLFPKPLLGALLASRSLSTVLPDGQVKVLNKYAPMGSALCFPVMALCIWAILAGSARDADARERILVYGDDVIVPTAEAENAMKQLEVFGFKVNRAKCCTKGFFRESCGVDAYNGRDVTPVKIKTVWASTHCPDAYSSWIDLSNQMYERRYYLTSELIAEWLVSIYGYIPRRSEVGTSIPSLVNVPENNGVPRLRWNKSLQRPEIRVRCVEPRKVEYKTTGWFTLLRYLTEKRGLANRDMSLLCDEERDQEVKLFQRDLERCCVKPSSVSSYTMRRELKFSWRWW